MTVARSSWNFDSHSCATITMTDMGAPKEFGGLNSTFTRKLLTYFIATSPITLNR
jgi:hypothetical protein